MAKTRNLRFVTPAGIASYPYLTRPDTRWQPTGEYKVDLILTPEDLEKELPKLGMSLTEVMEAELEKSYEKAIADMKPAAAKRVKKASLPLHPELDEEEEETGNFKLKAKMKAKVVAKDPSKSFTQKPVLFDSKGKEIVGNIRIGGGSRIKVLVEIAPYYTPKDKEAGISVRLKSVQIIKLQAYSMSNEFGVEEDGFDVDDADDSMYFSEEASDKANDSTGADTSADQDDNEEGEDDDF